MFPGLPVTYNENQTLTYPYSTVNNFECNFFYINTHSHSNTNRILKPYIIHIIQNVLVIASNNMIKCLRYKPIVEPEVDDDDDEVLKSVFFSLFIYMCLLSQNICCVISYSSCVAMPEVLNV